MANDCYDIIQYSMGNKIYKQTDFLVAQIFKKTSDVGEKSLPKEEGIPINLLIS